MKLPDDLVKRAVAAARILRPDAAYVPEDAAFDAAKRERLRAIVPYLDASRQDDLIQRTQCAVLDLLVMRDGPRAKMLCEKLVGLSVKAKAFVESWSVVRSDHSLRGALGDRLDGTIRRPPLPVLSATELLERDTWKRRLECAFDDDIWELIEEIGPMIEALSGAEKLKDPAEYLCAKKIAEAWKDALGEPPTLTRNKDAVSGEQRTVFQRFIEEAVPPPSVTEHVIRSVIDGMKVGETRPRKTARSSPQRTQGKE